MINRMLSRIAAAMNRLDKALSKKNMLLGALTALAFSGALALLNVDVGPLHNLNDIGGWSSRAVYIALTAAAHFAVLLAAAYVHRGRFSRLLLGQVILTAGLVILLQGVNQKTYFYTQVIQPLVRAMDHGGLAAAAGYDTPLSAPATLGLYLITRGPVYDMYMVKLTTITGYLLLCVMMMEYAQKKNLGWRGEALLSLCVILPQAFMHAGCTALSDVWCVLALACSLRFALDEKDCAMGKMAASALYGLAVAMSGLALYALPLAGYLAWKKKLTARHLVVAAIVPGALCLPMIAAGMGAGEALSSLIKANFSLPVYASGAPHALSWLPRAAVHEMEEYFMLSQVPRIDTVTNAQPYYTQAHFEQAALGVTIALQAAFCALAAWIAGRKMDAAGRAFALTLLALLCCPGATGAAWLAADLIGLYILAAKPRLRLPACLALFATAGTAAYPMLGETLLPMVYGFILCLIALCMLLDIIPLGRRTEE